ncbi:MAG: D-alanine--D-alanine ligase [Candidatus Omnitrophica bacterium]|nr:D-alanine--D-alanine ligase [Candidatus Omnitrophota bacterium]
MKKRVGVLMGGPSTERDISIKSGKAVRAALLNKGIDAVPVELEKAPNYSLRSGTGQARDMNGYKELAEKKIRFFNINAAFIALHGSFGEDGQVQEILEKMKIPYTGSKVSASKLGMDKASSKIQFESNNIPVPRYKVMHKPELDKVPEARVYFKELGTPLVIKPCCEGSSIGLSIIDREDDFQEALLTAFRYSDRVIIEEYAKGREITVGILEDKALPIVEIVPKKRFFDFEAKYQKGLTEYIVPAGIEKAKYLECQNTGLAAHKALAARFFSRVDMILLDSGAPVVLEVNTVPGLTEISLLPKAAQAAGIDFEKLILKIMESILW